MTLSSSFGQMERRRRWPKQEGWQGTICGIHRTPEPTGAFGNVAYGISIRFEFKAGALTAEEALRYAMSLPVATAITGIDSMDVLHCRNFFKNTAMMRGLLFIAATIPTNAAAAHCAVKRSGMHGKTKGLLALPHVRLDIERVSSGLIKTSRDGSQGDSSNVPRVSSTTFAIQANHRRWRGRRP